VVGGGGDESELGSILPVVFLGFGMLDEGAKFAFEVFESGWAVEGFVIAEEGDDDVGLELGEPLIGGGHGSVSGAARPPAVGGF